MKKRPAFLAVLYLLCHVTQGFAAESGEPSPSSHGDPSGVDWDVEAHYGAASVFGRGSDAVGIGRATSLFGGPRIRAHFGLYAMSLLCDFPLRAEESVDQRGEFVALALAPRFFPLGKSRRFEPSIGTIVGLSYLSGDIEGSVADVVYESRAAVAGVALGGLWTIGGPFSIGASATFLQLFIDDACVRFDDATTACDAQGGLSPRLITLQVSFRATL